MKLNRAWGYSGLFLLGSLAIGPGAQAEGKSTEAVKTTPPAWSAKMRELEKTLQEVLLDTSSDERFNNPKNFHRIATNAKTMAKLAHDLKGEKMASADADPTLKIIAGIFSEETAHAEKMLNSGYRDYARGILRSMPGYCIGCHTRNASGPSFAKSSEPAGFASLSWLEKGNFLAATRKFDQALEQYEQILSDPKFATKLNFDWEKAARAALAISVRVKQDPDQAMKIVERILANEKAPFFLRDQATKWKTSITKWKAEPKREATTEEGLRTEAIRLVAEAASIQKYAADRGGDVAYLRASAATHDLLSRGPQGEKLADALYMAGLNYEALQGLNFWDLHEFYYIACIRQAPHTPVARQCFKHFEENVFQGYTGSAGTDVPRNLELKIQELDELSSALITPKKPL